MGCRVSVIIPTYNRADLVGQAVDSALLQSVGEVEVIVVDDGSTDNTAEIVGAYGDRVRYIRTENRGVGHARNVGTRHATGRYLTFLDSDDCLYPYALELLSEVLERFPYAGLACAEMSGFDDNGFFDRFHLKSYHSSTYRDHGMTYERIYGSRTRLKDLGVAPGALLAEDAASLDRAVYIGNVFDAYLLELVLCQNTAMVRREVATAIGDRNERVSYFEEFDYLLRICRSYDVCFVDVPTYKLRYHRGQISTTAGPRGKYVWMRKQQELLRLIKRHAFADPGYYERHRARIDRQLARLHRAVAVPMMLQGGSGTALARRSRVYLSRARRYGQAEWSLWASSYLPGPLRRLGVSLVEHLRTRRFRSRGTAREAS